MFSKRISALLLLLIVVFAFAINTTSAAKKDKKSKTTTTEAPVEESSSDSDSSSGSDEDGGEEEGIHASIVGIITFGALMITVVISYVLARIMCDDGQRELEESRKEKIENV